MGLLRVRFIVFLSLLYLGMVFMLYHYLWRSHTFERGLSLLDSSHRQMEDYEIVENKGVLYSFKRRNGFFEDKTNGSTSSSPSPPLLPSVKALSNTTSKASPHVVNHTRMANRIRMMNRMNQMNRTHKMNRTNYTTGKTNHTQRINHVQISKQSQSTAFSLKGLPAPSRCIHAFYYMWYGNPSNDNGAYYHWNHHYLPHWNRNTARKFPQGRHTPPDDIGASFYPELGCYSSRDPAVIEAHMHQLRRAGVGVVSVSWYPLGMADDEGVPVGPDPLIPLLLDIAQKYSIQVSLHIEPYKGRSAQTVRRDLKYIVETYGSHPAFFKHRRHTGNSPQRSLPVIYMYDSYLIQAREWAAILKPGAPTSIRGTDLDCMVIGLLVESSHQQSILSAGFDGFYTYFAASGFSYGSTPANWRQLATFAANNNLLFIPSFGPGYDDVRVRPWNGVNTKSRGNGQYYRSMFHEAILNGVNPTRTDASIVSLTSFNEWGEGTQIEPAVPKSTNGFTYSDYSPHQPDYYLQLTREIAGNMQCNM